MSYFINSELGLPSELPKDFIFTYSLSDILPGSTLTGEHILGFTMCGDYVFSLTCEDDYIFRIWQFCHGDPMELIFGTVINVDSDHLVEVYQDVQGSRNLVITANPSFVSSQNSLELVDFVYIFLVSAIPLHYDQSNVRKVQIPCKMLPSQTKQRQSVIFSQAKNLDFFVWETYCAFIFMSVGDSPAEQSILTFSGNSWSCDDDELMNYSLQWGVVLDRVSGDSSVVLQICWVLTFEDAVSYLIRNNYLVDGDDLMMHLLEGSDVYASSVYFMLVSRRGHLFILEWTPRSGDLRVLEKIRTGFGDLILLKVLGCIQKQLKWPVLDNKAWIMGRSLYCIMHPSRHIAIVL